MRKLLVASHKGGVGKTTTCLNLGAATAQAGSRVLLVDADPLSAISALLNLAEHPGRGSLRQIGIDLPGVLVTGAIPGLDIISPFEEGGCTDKDLDDLLGLLASPALEDTYGCMIVDTPPFMGANPVQLLNTCDEFVVVMRAEPLAYRTLPAFLELVQRSKQPGKGAQMLGILLTLPESEPVGGRWECELRGRFGSQLPQVVPYDEEVGKALLVGQIVSLYNPEAEAARQYLQLAETLTLAGAAESNVTHAGESPLVAAAASLQLAGVSFNSCGGSTAVAVEAPPLQEEEPGPEELGQQALEQLPTNYKQQMSSPELDLLADITLPEEPDLPAADVRSLPELEPAVFDEPIAPPKFEPKPVAPSARLTPPRPAKPRAKPAAPAAAAAPAPAPAPVPAPAPAAPTPVAGGLRSQYPWAIWIGLAVAGGVGLRFIKLPEWLLPIVVGLAVAGAVVLLLRLIQGGSGDPIPPPAPSQPARAGNRSAAPARTNGTRPEHKTDANSRLANLTRRATRPSRRNNNGH